MTLLELSAKIARYWRCAPAQAGTHAYRVLCEYPPAYRAAACAALEGKSPADIQLAARGFLLEDACALAGCDALMGVELLRIYEKDEAAGKELLFRCGAHDGRA
ncbi:hypothetical protein H8S23_06505 [Anaerofilum sp. BX8]|uniref:Uncharacterized protein n=1 Tax=Anaerofilum hominis TaxID=2763016 RepID=A0A923L1E8_9FIRM|nr:hypothetical protein [Anaerofilum hominis]MBC5581153.1 hypothetical protein [Anaerofilum hominis]